MRKNRVKQKFSRGNAMCNSLKIGLKRRNAKTRFGIMMGMNASPSSINHPIIHAWHSPQNSLCAQNADIDAACTCKRVVERKPYRVVRIHERNPPHRVSDKLVVKLWPDGRMEIREHGRRFSVTVQISYVYDRAKWRQAMLEAAAYHKAKAGKKKGKQGNRKGHRK